MTERERTIGEGEWAVRTPGRAAPSPRLLYATSLVSVFAVGIGTAAAQSASSFQNSCGNISVSGAILSADCRRQDGSFTRTSIEIPGIANIDGVLQFTGDQSSFQRSCGDIRVQGDILWAMCRRGDGGYSRSSIEIPDIVNIGGVLQYADNAAPPPDMGAPPDAGDETFFYNGDNYEWYDDGWSGPGYYIVGYQFRRGHGFGGGEGWHGWRHRHPGGGFPNGGHPQFQPGSRPEFHPNQPREFHPGQHPEFHPGPRPDFHPGPHPGPQFHIQQPGANAHPPVQPGGPSGGHPQPTNGKPPHQ